MLQKIDDFLIDKVFQKIADFSFNYFGLSGVRIAHYLLPFAIICLTLNIFFIWKSPLIAVVFLIIGVLHTAGEKSQLRGYEKRLMEGVRNVRRTNNILLFFRFCWCLSLIVGPFFVWVDADYKYLFFSSIFFALNQYLDATDINPPKKKKSFKLALEPQ